MAKKNNVTSLNIIEWYMAYVLEYGESPKSVFSFAKLNNFDESVFYQFFGSFYSLEQQIFCEFHSQTISLIEKSDEYANFNSKNKLLTYYFTLFETLTANRSYVILVLKENKKKLESLKMLAEFKKIFNHFIDSLDIEMIDLKKESFTKIQKKGLQESAWLQLMITLKFWMDDSSPSFEKTDLFIEKSLKASFDVIDTTPVKSIIDLGKFLFKEKIQMN